MPFTLVHPAAVVPLARSPLVPSALVAGAMAPDLPYYVSLQWIGGDYNLTLTHDVGSLLWLDPLIALALLVAFHAVLKRPLVALLPDAAAGRVLPWVAALRWREAPAVGWIAVSAVVGAGTHLAWDALCDAFAPGTSTGLNLASDLVGTVVLVWWLVHWWRATAPAPIPAGATLRAGLRHLVVGATIVLSAAWVVVRGVRLAAEVGAELRSYDAWSRSAVAEYVVRGAVVDAATALAVIVGVHALGWHLHRWWSSRTARIRRGSGRAGRVSSGR